VSGGLQEYFVEKKMRYVTTMWIVSSFVKISIRKDVHHIGKRGVSYDSNTGTG